MTSGMNRAEEAPPPPEERRTGSAAEGRGMRNGLHVSRTAEPGWLCLQLAAGVGSERSVPRHPGAGAGALARGQGTWGCVPALPLSGPVPLGK